MPARNGAPLAGCFAAQLGVLLSLVLAGCSVDEESQIAGERIPVRSIVRPVVDIQTDLAQPLPPARPNSSWPQVGGGPSRTGLHPEIGSEFARQWSYATNAGTRDEWPYVAEPIVDGGLIFVLDGNGIVHAVRPEDGGLAWKRSVSPEEEDEEEGIGGGLAAEDGRVYVTTGYGELIALAMEDGRILWRALLDAPLRAAPLVADGQVAALARNDVLQVFDAITGKPIWSARGVGAGITYLYGAAPAMRDDILVVPYSSGELVAYRGDNGRKLWTHVLAVGARDTPLAEFSDISSAPIFDEHYVFAGTRRGEFAAIDWKEGTVAWRQEIGIGNRAWVLGGSVFLLDLSGVLMRLSKTDGVVFWRQALPIYEDPEDRETPIHYSAPVVMSGRLLLASSEGKLLIFDAETGESGARIDIGGAARVAPSVANRTVYVFRDDGVLIALR